MGSAYSSLLSSPPFFRPLKRPSSPIASTSQPPKRRKTSYRGNEEDPHPTTSQATKREVREECESSSDSDPCHQVFLSHSAHQKSFVEQLFLDLQTENISCFFDKHPESLPKGEDFPSRIFKAARECRVGVVVLSDEFIASKWPMLELCEFVRAKNSTNGRLKILPLFFRLSTQSLGEKLQYKDSLKRSWQELLQDQKRTTDLDEWVEALKALRSINGIVYNEQETEVDYRAKIVSSIRSLLPPKRPYDESQVQGKQRLCQKVARLFNDTPWAEDGVKMAGVYGIAGMGKTTLARLACNFYSDDFDGRVLHVELGEGLPIERLKRALRSFANASEMLLHSITDIEEGWRVFNQKMMFNGKVFLAIDNISDLEESIAEAQKYLRAVRSAGNQSMILLTARSSTILRRFIPEGERRCMHVPSLTEEEAIPILFQLTPLRVSNLTSEKLNIAKMCAMKCYFSWRGERYNLLCSAYHPLALRALGAFLYDSWADLSEWINIQHSSEPWKSSQDKLFNIFEECFNRLSEEQKKIFMFLCLYLPESHMISKDAFNWLALACDTKVEHIKFAIVELRRKGFVESRMESGIQPYIHDLHREFAVNKADGTGEWISLKDIFDIPACLQKNDQLPFLAMKFDNCHFQCPGFVNVELFRNVAVLHLQDMPQLKLLNLSPMRIVRSITVIGCAGLQQICGLESLTSLVYFVIKVCSADVQFSGMEGLVTLQHLQVNAIPPESITELSLLRWTSFPPLQDANSVGTICLEHVQKSTGRLDLSSCSKLQTIELTNCKSWNEICLFSPNSTGSETLAFCAMVESRSLSTTGPGFSNLHELCSMEIDRLKELPTFAELTTLLRITLEGMHSLKKPPTLTGLTSLQHLQLEGMDSVKELPALTGLTSLRWLQLEGMDSLKELPALTGLTSLRRVRLEGMDSLKELPALTGLTSLRRVWLVEMHSLKELSALTGLTSLRRLWLEGMHGLKELPALTGLTSLRRLRLEGMNSLKELPALTGLTSLQWLWLEEMHGLKELSALTGLTSLTELRLQGMHNLKELPALTGLTSLWDLRLKGMHSLKELPALTRLTSLQGLWLEEMHSLKELPALIGLTSLQWLWLEEMHSLKELPALTGLTSLQWLRLQGMHSLKELPALTELTSLRDLRLKGMHSLKRLPALTGLTSLEMLWLEGMHSLKELPALTGLTLLQRLRLHGMHSLKELPALTGLTSLQWLLLEEMDSLKELPALTGLNSLRYLRLEGMHSLKELPALSGLPSLRVEGIHILKEQPRVQFRR